MSKSNVISPFHGQHNHQDCQDDALLAAEEECARQGLKLTPLRRQVLNIIWTSHNPIGAYDILQRLQELGHKPAPPTAYRTLDFLVSANLVHRLESMNAYIGCPRPDANHLGQFYICQQCGHAAEVHSETVTLAINNEAKQLGFTQHAPMIEVHGVCASCAENN